MSGFVKYQKIDGDRHKELVLDDGRPMSELRLSELRQMFGHLGIGPQSTKDEILDRVLASKRVP